MGVVDLVVVGHALRSSEVASRQGSGNSSRCFYTETRLELRRQAVGQMELPPFDPAHWS